MFLSLDGTAWIQLLNFVIFFSILSVVFIRPVSEAIKRRRQYIDSVHGDYDRYAHQVSTLRAQAEAERLAARREAEEKDVAARAAADGEAAAIASDFESKAGEIAQTARDTVQGEMNAAREREHELAGSLAESLLQRAIGASR